MYVCPNRSTTPKGLIKSTQIKKKKGASSGEEVADSLVVQDLVIALEVVLQTTGRLNPR